VLDRLVDWQDRDGDGRADAQVLLALSEGGPEAKRLSGYYVEQRDEVRGFWHLTRWHYAQPEGQFHSDFSGDLKFAAIHVDPRGERWEAFDESFFGFYDPDGDGFSEEALRVSGVGTRVDAIRWSFDLDDDGGQDAKTPLPYDYDLSITTDGHLLLAAAVMETVRVCARDLPTLRWSKAREWAVQAVWRRALLAFDENDANHDPRDPEQRERWEGVIAEDPGGFPRAGGPSCGQLGKRYELRSTKGPIELYHSGVDGRIHLLGADRGWLDLDTDTDGALDARLEMEDANSDGFFDAWKWDLGADGTIEATYESPDPQATMVALDGQALRAAEQRIRERSGAFSQQERFAQDVARWTAAGRFLPVAE
jgi:hypothetical protein